ncbi:hypothetical protein AAE028_33260 [Sinorhizobium sp. CB9]
MQTIGGRAATSSSSRRFWSRLWPVSLLYSLAVIAALVTIKLPSATDYVGGDNDDGMRLVEVRDLLAGQGWFDLTQYRLGLEGGTLMHWSRLIDLPIASLIAFFGLFFPPERAEAIALAIWPLLLVIPVMAAMALAGRRAGGALAMHISLGLTAMLLITSNRFMPGAIDHHNVQLGLAAVMLAMLIDGKYRAASFAIAGLAAALAIAIGAETTPFVAVSCLVVALLWAWEGKAFAAAAQAFGLALALAISVFFFLTVPPRLYSTVTCDNLSLGFYGLSTLGGGLLLASAIFASHFSRGVRFAILGGVGAVVFATALVLAPKCLGSPLAGLDPMLVELWLNGVMEAQSFLDLTRERTNELGAFYATGLLAMAVCVFRILRGDRTQMHAIFLGLLTVNWGVALIQVRGAPFANLLAVLPLVLLLLDLRRISNSDPEDMSAAFFYVVTALASVPAVWAVGGALTNGQVENLWTATEPSDANGKRACTAREAMAQLASLPTGVVVASSEMGVPILRFTAHRTLSAPYHRDQGGMLTELHVGLAEPREADAFLRGAGVTILAFCPDDSQTRRLAELKPDGLYAQLLQGRIPAYLQALPKLQASDLRLFLYRPSGG